MERESAVACWPSRKPLPPTPAVPPPSIPDKKEETHAWNPYELEELSLHVAAAEDRREELCLSVVAAMKNRRC